MAPPMMPKPPPAGGSSAVPPPLSATPKADAEVQVLFRLRNGRQGEPYAEPLQSELRAPQSSASPAGTTTVRLIDVHFPPELGLSCDLRQGTVSGTPRLSGDISVLVQYRLSHDSPVKVREARISLYVNPDPRTLWKNLPSNPADPWWKADDASQSGVGAERRLVAARKRGRSHAHVGSCCDDDFWIQHVATGDWYLAIVADGAGSAPASRLGSRLAVEAAGRSLLATLAAEGGERIEQTVAAVLQHPADPEPAQRDLQQALQATLGHAAGMAMQALHAQVRMHPELGPVKNLATTLLIGVARRFGSHWLCAAYWVGDGAVAVYRKGRDVTLLGSVDAGEYAGQTQFLDDGEVTPEGVQRRTRAMLCEHFTGLVLMTDGVSDPYFATDANLQQLAGWDALWADVEPHLAGHDGASVEAGLLGWLDFWSQGNHDDRTIAMIY